MKSIKLLLILILLCEYSSVFAWDGYDYDNKTSINIAEGNLVREGNVIQFYDSVSDNFHMAKIVFIQSVAIGTEIELYDLDDKKTRFFIMKN